MTVPAPRLVVLPATGTGTATSADAGAEAAAAGRAVPVDDVAPLGPEGYAEAHPDVLAARARAGDQAAVAALVTRYHARCLRFARNIGLTHEDAEEAVQDAFVRMARALPRFHDGAPFEPWLFRILGNRCRTARMRARRWLARHVDGEAMETVAVARDDAAAAADAELRRAAVVRALERLPRDLREAFLLHHVEELDYTAMERVTGVGRSALKMRVKRACDALRAQLGVAPPPRRPSQGARP